MSVAYVVWYGGRTSQSVKTFLPGKTARRRALRFAKTHAANNGTCIRAVKKAGPVKTVACFLPGGRRSKVNRIPKSWRKIS